jgi:dynein heavy chain
MSQQLDDHLVMLQSMGFSPYKKPFEDRLAKWDTTLNLVSWADGLCQLHALHAQ